MIRAFLLCLTLLSLKVYVDAAFEKWQDNTNKYTTDLEAAVKMHLRSKDSENFKLDNFVLRSKYRTHGVIIGHTSDDGFWIFWVDGIGVESKTEPAVIKSVYRHSQYLNSKLQFLLDVAENSEKEGWGFKKLLPQYPDLLPLSNFY